MPITLRSTRLRAALLPLLLAAVAGPGTATAQPFQDPAFNALYAADSSPSWTSSRASGWPSAATTTRRCWPRRSPR